MVKKDVKKDEKAQMPSTLDYHYIKSNFFRVIHVDGIVGSITPNGQGVQAGCDLPPLVGQP
jgi:hypothetical protein